MVTSGTTNAFLIEFLLLSYISLPSFLLLYLFLLLQLDNG